jgi:hypothetical protein
MGLFDFKKRTEERLSEVKGGHRTTSEKIRIESDQILDFVSELGAYAAADFYKLDPKRKLRAIETKQLRTMADLVTLSITQGIILANYQPELASVLVKQLNQKKAGFADEQLKQILFMYEAFIKEGENKQGDH